METFKCKECPKTFSTFRSLNGHMRMHINFQQKKRMKCVHYAVCKTCNVDFSYEIGKSNGLYCSLPCFHESIRVKTNDKIKSGDLNGINISTIKKYILETRGPFCEALGCTVGNVWNGLPIVLQLDHVDGNSDNNVLSNLRLLCPNCHTQTHTWGYRSSKSSKRQNYMKERRAKTNTTFISESLGSLVQQLDFPIECCIDIAEVTGRNL